MRWLALIAALWATPGAAAGVIAASYENPTGRYPHAVLGDALEWGSLRLDLANGQSKTITLPETRVFEDTQPRLADVDLDGDFEVIAVESDSNLGARLSVYDETGLISSNAFIGQRFRWLAPVAIADLDGDGQVELAFVDRPHLAKTLRVFRYAPDVLIEVGRFPGVTNHRIGEPDIAGGFRNCGSGTEMIVADARWQRLLSLRFDGQSVSAEDIGPHEGRASFQAALSC